MFCIKKNKYSLLRKSLFIFFVYINFSIQSLFAADKDSSNKPEKLHKSTAPLNSSSESSGAPKPKRQRFHDNAEPEKPKKSQRKKKHTIKNWRQETRQRALLRRQQQKQKSSSTVQKKKSSQTKSSSRKQAIRHRAKLRLYKKIGYSYQTEQEQNGHTSAEGTQSQEIQPQPSTSAPSPDPELLLGRAQYLQHQAEQAAQTKQRLEEEKARKKRAKQAYEMQRLQLKIKTFCIKDIEESGGIQGMQEQIFQNQRDFDKSVNGRLQRIYERLLARRAALQRAQEEALQDQASTSTSTSNREPEPPQPSSGSLSLLRRLQQIAQDRKTAEQQSSVGTIPEKQPQTEEERRLYRENQQKKAEVLRKKEEERKEKERLEDEEEARISALEKAQEKLLEEQTRLLQQKILLAKKTLLKIKQETSAHRRFHLQRTGRDLFDIPSTEEESSAASVASSEEEASTVAVEPSSSQGISAPVPVLRSPSPEFFSLEIETDTSEHEPTTSAAVAMEEGTSVPIEEQSQKNEIPRRDTSDSDNSSSGVESFDLCYEGDPEPPGNEAPPPFSSDSSSSDEEPLQKRPRVSEGLSEDSSSSFCSINFETDTEGSEKEDVPQQQNIQQAQESKDQRQAEDSGDEGPSSLLEQRAVTAALIESILQRQQAEEEERRKQVQRQEQLEEETLEQEEQRRLREQEEQQQATEEHLPFPDPVQQQRGKILCSQSALLLKQYQKLISTRKMVRTLGMQLQEAILKRTRLETNGLLPPIVLHIKKKAQSLRGSQSQLSSTEPSTSETATTSESSTQPSTEPPATETTTTSSTAETATIPPSTLPTDPHLRSFALETNPQRMLAGMEDIELASASTDTLELIPLSPLQDTDLEQAESMDLEKNQRLKNRKKELEAQSKETTQKKLEDLRKLRMHLIQSSLTDAQKEQQLKMLQNMEKMLNLRKSQTLLLKVNLQQQLIKLHERILTRHIERTRNALLDTSDYTIYHPYDHENNSDAENQNEEPGSPGDRGNSDPENQNAGPDSPQSPDSTNEGNEQNSTSENNQSEEDQNTSSEESTDTASEPEANVSLPEWVYPHHSGRLRSHTLKRTHQLFLKGYSRSDTSNLPPEEDKENTRTDTSGSDEEPPSKRQKLVLTAQKDNTQSSQKESTSASTEQQQNNENPSTSTGSNEKSDKPSQDREENSRQQQNTQDETSSEDDSDSDTGSIHRFSLDYHGEPEPPGNEAVPPMEEHNPFLENTDDEDDEDLLSTLGEDEDLGLSTLFNEEELPQKSDQEKKLEGKQKKQKILKKIQRTFQNYQKPVIPIFLLNYNKVSQAQSLSALQQGIATQTAHVTHSTTGLMNQITAHLYQTYEKSEIDQNHQLENKLNRNKNALQKFQLRQSKKPKICAQHPYRVFASMHTPNSSLQHRPFSTQVGCIINPFSKIRFGIAYNYEQNTLKKYSGVNTCNNVSYAKIGNKNNLLSGSFAWNTQGSGIQSIFIASSGWGKNKNQRYYTQKYEILQGIGRPTTKTRALLVQLGYALSLTDFCKPNNVLQFHLLTPYIKITAMRTKVHTYTEKNTEFSSVIKPTQVKMFEKTIGIQMQCSLYSKYEFQIWTAAVHGQKKLSSLSSYIVGFKQLEYAAYTPQSKETYTQGELGVSMNTCITKRLGIGVTTTFRTQSSKNPNQGCIHTRLWYDF